MGFALNKITKKMLTQSTGSNARLVTCGYTLHASQTITIYWETTCVSIVLFNENKLLCNHKPFQYSTFNMITAIIIYFTSGIMLLSIQIIASHMLP